MYKENCNHSTYSRASTNRRLAVHQWYLIQQSLHSSALLGSFFRRQLHLVAVAAAAAAEQWDFCLQMQSKRIPKQKKHKFSKMFWYAVPAPLQATVCSSHVVTKVVIRPEMDCQPPVINVLMGLSKWLPLNAESFFALSCDALGIKWSVG